MREREEERRYEKAPGFLGHRVRNRGKHKNKDYKNKYSREEWFCVLL